SRDPGVHRCPAPRPDRIAGTQSCGAGYPPGMAGKDTRDRSCDAHDPPDDQPALVVPPVPVRPDHRGLPVGQDTRPGQGAEGSEPGCGGEVQDGAVRSAGLMARLQTLKPRIGTLAPKVR